MDLLTILKFAGIIVSGALGILGTVTETRNKETHRLTTWGRCALWLTIAGFAVALGAQLAETIKQNQEQAKSRKDAEAQIKQANEVLKRLELQGQQSRTILTNLEWQGDLAKQSLGVLSTQSAQSARILSQLGDQATAISTQSTQSLAVLAGVQQQGISIERLLTRLRTISLDVVFELPTTNAPGSNFLATLRQRIKPESQDPGNGETLNFPFYLAQTTNTGFFSQVERLMILGWNEPYLQVGLNREPVEPKSLLIDEQRYDLRIMDKRKNVTPWLFYYPHLGRIFILFQDWELPLERWNANGKITSIADLSKAQLLIRVGSVRNLRQTLHANRAVIHFDNHSIPLNSFRHYWLDAPVSEAFLPDARTILDAPDRTPLKSLPGLDPDLVAP